MQFGQGTCTVLYGMLQVGTVGVLCTGMWEAWSRLHKLLAWQCE